MCGECFFLFPTTEEFNAHHCQESQVPGVESIVEENVNCQEQVTDSLTAAGNNPCKLAFQRTLNYSLFHPICSFFKFFLCK